MSGSPNQTRDQLMQLFDQNINKPIIEPIRAQKENVKYYASTAYDHTRSLGPFFARKWRKIEDDTSKNLTQYHRYRREMPWEMITGVGVLGTIASLPYGAQATARNALLLTVGATLLINPEWLYDQYKFYSINGVAAKDSTNRSTFNW